MKYIRTSRQESKVTVIAKGGNVDIVMLDDIEVTVVDHEEAEEELTWFAKDYEDSLRMKNSFAEDKTITVSSRDYDSTAWTVLSFSPLDI